jgi:hypothetical protein
MDCMFSADLMVRDTLGTARLLVDRLGLPALRPTWTDHGRTLEELLYLRAYHPLSSAAPTNIEIINPDLYPKLNMRPAAAGRQTPGRPIQTHATVLITKHYDEMIARMREHGVRHYDMPDPGDGLARCWFGVEDLSVDDPARNDYDPTSDGWTFLEVISWEGTTLAIRDPIPVRVGEGGVTRVVARTYLVPDIDATMASLRVALAWPGPDVMVKDSDGARYATLQPAMSQSCALELVDASHANGRHGAFFSRWGLGPHALRLGVNGLAAKADDLRRRGTPFTESDTLGGEPVLVVGAEVPASDALDDDVLGGAIVEFIDDSAFVASAAVVQSEAR